MEFMPAIPRWRELIGISFLTESQRKLYLALLDRRCGIMGF
jgi:hypothetical protein